MFTVASVIEVFGISLQRWRGEESHFNEETAFDTVLSRGGLAGGAMVLALFVVAATVLSLRPAPYLPASMRLALRAGWLLLLGAMAVGVAMVVTAVTELNAEGVPEPVQQQAAYSSAGWLKPAHAITMHAILLLPGLAWLASHTAWEEARRFRVVAWPPPATVCWPWWWSARHWQTPGRCAHLPGLTRWPPPGCSALPPRGCSS